MALTTGKSADATVIRPFAIETPEPEIEELRARIGRRAGPFGREGLPELLYFNEVDAGNHYAARQEPELFTTEVGRGSGH
jgi:hypothetical protein